MKVGFLQIDIKKDIVCNIGKMTQFIFNNEQVDLFIIPELADRGYLYNSQAELFHKATDLDNNIVINHLRALTMEHKKTVIVGVAEKEGINIYNSAVIINQGDIIGVYRKIHLTNYEKKFFTPGEENTVFDICGVKVGIQICFDTWFPEMSREQLNLGADFICVLGNFGSMTTFDICRTRAIENCIPVLLCNRTGEEGNADLKATFIGNSAVFEPNGNILFDPCPEECYLEFDLKEFRKNSNHLCHDLEAERNIDYYCKTCHNLPQSNNDPV